MFNRKPIRTTAIAAGVAVAALTPPVALAATRDATDQDEAQLADARARALLVEPGPLGLTAELRELAATRHLIVARNLTLVRRVAKLKDQPSLTRKHRRKLRHWSNDAIRGNTRKLRGLEDNLREQARQGRLAARATGSAGGTVSSTGGATVASGTLETIAACESGGDPAAIGGGGMYRGKYQFAQSTWEAVGGTGDPAAAPEAVQDQMAARLYAQSGSSPWPNCG